MLCTRSVGILPEAKMESARQYSHSAILPNLNAGGDGRYLWVLNQVDQTVSIIDTGAATGSGDLSATITATVTLTAGKAFRSGAFRPINKSVYLFGTNSIDVIDLDPASGTFSTMTVNYTVTLAANDCYDAVYDRFNDKFYLAGRTFDPVALTVSSHVNKYGLTLNLSQFGRSYMMTEKTMLLNGLRDKSVIDILTDLYVNSIPNQGTSQGEIAYDSVERLFINTVGGGISVFDFDLILKALITGDATVGQAGICVAYPQRKVFQGAQSNNKIQIFSLTTLASLGGFTKANLGTNEAVTRGLVYSPYSDRVFAQASTAAVGTLTGVNRVHVLDPNEAVVANTEKGYITVGNMGHSQNSDFGINQIGLNMIRL